MVLPRPRVHPAAPFSAGRSISNQPIDQGPLSSLENKGTWVRWGLLATGLLFLLPVAWNLKEGAIADAAIELCVGAAGLGGFLGLSHAQRERHRFIQWLTEHRADILAERASYQGFPVTLETPVRTYQIAVSLVLMSATFPSAYVIDPERSGTTGWFSTLASMLLGWWGIPLGPIYTVRAVALNLRGGEVVSVGDLLEGFKGGSSDGATVTKPVTSATRIVLAIVAVPASLVLTTMAILWFFAELVVSFHNSTPQRLSLTIDGKALGSLEPGATSAIKMSPGSHQVVAHAGGRLVERGQFSVPKPRDPFLGFSGVYVLGDTPRLALVSRCYGPSTDPEPLVLPIQVPAKFFPMPKAVYAGVPLDEPFAANARIDGPSQIQTHLCSLDASGKPRCRFE